MTEYHCLKVLLNFFGPNLFIIMEPGLLQVIHKNGVWKSSRQITSFGLVQ